MSEIKNGRLGRYGAEHSKCQERVMTAGFKGLSCDYGITDLIHGHLVLLVDVHVSILPAMRRLASIKSQFVLSSEVIRLRTGSAHVIIAMESYIHVHMLLYRTYIPFLISDIRARRAERHSARMSEIKNGRSDLCGKV